MTAVLRDLVVLVTGATDGIGLATARRLTGEGAGVLVHGRNPAKVRQVVRELRDGGGEAEGLVADLASLEQTAGLAREVAETAPRLDVLINNAGIGAGALYGRRERGRICCGLGFGSNSGGATRTARCHSVLPGLLRLSRNARPGQSGSAA